ncbi:Arylacetamide deacetylase [Aphelenchoides besseyi]|nr:Arylacetamide deacetylase [Aphelenchoides besseyi]
MFVFLEAGRFLYGDILVDLITSLVYPEADLRLKVGLVREPQDVTTWLSVVSGMTVATFLLITAILFLIASALFIPLPYEICDRQKVQLFELLLRLSNEHLGHVVEILFGSVARNHLTRFVAGLPYIFPPRTAKWCSIRDEVIAGTKCRVYMPDKAKKTSNSLIIFIHGGGWCICQARKIKRLKTKNTRLGFYDGPMVSLIGRTGTPIISIDYKLSPEVQFPSAIDECEAVIKEIYYKKHSELGIDPERILLMGDSAGGNLSAVLCQRFLKIKKEYVKCQILIYPVIHLLDFLAPSHQYYYRSYKGTALLNPHSLARWCLMYLGIEVSRKNIKLVLKNKHLPRDLMETQAVQSMLDYYTHLPESFLMKGKYSKPLASEPDEKLSSKFAPFVSNPEICPILGDNLEGLPPALIMTAGVDILRDEGILYAKRLKEFNVPTKWNHYESAFHGVLNMPGSKQRKQMLNDIHAYVQELKLL